MLPSVAALRDARLRADITWVINPEMASLRGNQDVKFMHSTRAASSEASALPDSLFPWIKKTRLLKPGSGARFPGLLRSALIAAAR